LRPLAQKRKVADVLSKIKEAGTHFQEELAASKAATAERLQETTQETPMTVETLP